MTKKNLKIGLIVAVFFIIFFVVVFGDVSLQVQIVTFSGNFIREVNVAAFAFWLVLWLYQLKKKLIQIHFKK